MWPLPSHNLFNSSVLTFLKSGFFAPIPFPVFYYSAPYVTRHPSSQMWAPGQQIGCVWLPYTQCSAPSPAQSMASGERSLNQQLALSVEQDAIGGVVKQRVWPGITLKRLTGYITHWFPPTTPL
jgi:hypothetical protein